MDLILSGALHLQFAGLRDCDGFVLPRYELTCAGLPERTNKGVELHTDTHVIILLSMVALINMQLSTYPLLHVSTSADPSEAKNKNPMFSF